MIGIRREDKNKWERRVPLIPEHVKDFKKKYDISTVIQPSEIRVYTDDEYKKSGADVKEDLSECSVVFAVKEIPIHLFRKNTAYVFFSHTIKGQDYNMPMLQEMMDLGCTLIDYEKIVNERGFRLVFFGKYAGLAGMIDTLWAYGQRLKSQGINSPFSQIKKTVDYTHHLPEIKQHLQQIGKKIEQDGLPESITPVVVGFAGYGNVSKGAQEILDILPVKKVSPKNLKDVFKNPSNHCVYKVVFKEEDMVAPRSEKQSFNLQEYYDHPEKYISIFDQYIPHLTMLMNCIYWDTKYPRLISKNVIKKLYSPDLQLHVIGDISVDVNGAIEFTEKTTDSGNPVFVYNPSTDQISDGCNGDGIAVMAVDNLPCELPRESSRSFSDSLYRFVPAIATADFTADFDVCVLPDEIRKAVILYKGRLTPDYEYINKFL